MDIYLIRHTRVNTAPGVCYGQTDAPVAESFPSECAALRRTLPQDIAWVVYSSSLSRCRKLAEQFGADAIHTDARLLELNFGDWEGQTWEAIGAETLERWSTDFVNQPCPNGESFCDLSRRVKACWADICQQPHSHVLIFTHAGVIRALLSHLLGFPLRNAMQVTIDYGSVTKIRLLEYGAVVDYVNRVVFLQG